MTLFCILDAGCAIYDRAAKIPGLSHSGALCENCKERAEREIALLRYDYVDLSQRIPRMDRRQSEQIFRPKPESTPPINLEVLTLRSEIVHVATLAAMTLRSGQPPPGREGFRLEWAIGRVLVRLDALVSQPPVEAWWNTDDLTPTHLDGTQILARLRSLHHRARVLTGVEAPLVSLPGDCPSCAQATLRRSADDLEKVWCHACRAVFTHAEYVHHLLLA